jgi:hypothetical protein
MKMHLPAQNPLNSKSLRQNMRSITSCYCPRTFNSGIQMNFFSRIRWFQKAYVGIFCLFMGTIVFVIAVAYSRRSGNTGLDMAKIQQLRQSIQKSEVKKM